VQRVPGMLGQVNLSYLLPCPRPENGAGDHDEKGLTMTNQEICDFYDNNPNLTLAQLANMLGLSVDQVKTILQTPVPVQSFVYRRGQSQKYRG